MKNKRLFLLCGCPGSGKSTWIRQRINTYGGYHISRDEIRFAILDERGGNYFDYENEVIRTFIARINELLDNMEDSCIMLNESMGDYPYLSRFPEYIDRYNSIIDDRQE